MLLSAAPAGQGRALRVCPPGWAARLVGRASLVENCLGNAKRKKKSKQAHPAPVPSVAFMRSCELIVINNISFSVVRCFPTFCCALFFRFLLQPYRKRGFPEQPCHQLLPKPVSSSRRRAKHHPSSLMGWGR